VVNEIKLRETSIILHNILHKQQIKGVNAQGCRLCNMLYMTEFKFTFATTPFINLFRKEKSHLVKIDTVKGAKKFIAGERLDSCSQQSPVKPAE